MSADTAAPAGLLRPLIGVGVIVFRRGPAGLEVLLVKRGRAPQAGEWSLPGGKQEHGETVRDAARREVLEETGLAVEVVGLVDVVDAITADPARPDGPPAHHYTLIDFAAVCRTGEPVPGDDAVAAVWADPDALDAYDLWSETQRVIAIARRQFAPD